MFVWMLLLALQWTVVLLTETYAWITTVFWTIIAVQKISKNTETTETLINVAIIVELITGSLMIGSVWAPQFGLWVVAQCVTLFYYLNHTLPKVNPGIIMAWISFAGYIIASFFATYAWFSAIAWPPFRPWRMPIPALLAAVSIVGCFFETKTCADSVVTGALVALNFNSFAAEVAVGTRKLKTN